MAYKFYLKETLKWLMIKRRWMIERKKKVQLILMIMKNQHSLNAQQELNKVYQWVNITHLILDSDQILKPSHHSLILLRHWCIHQVLVLLIWNCKMTIIILVEEGVLQLAIVVYHLLLELEVNLPNTIYSPCTVLP